LNSATNRINILNGLQEESVQALNCALSLAEPGAAKCGVGLDSTSAYTGTVGVMFEASGGSAVGVYTGFTGLGWHYVQALEYGGTSVSFGGDFGNATIFQSGFHGRGHY
jgi:hypothetical protein